VERPPYPVAAAFADWIQQPHRVARPALEARQPNVHGIVAPPGAMSMPLPRLLRHDGSHPATPGYMTADDAWR